MRTPAPLLTLLFLTASALVARVFTDQTGRSFEGELIESSETTATIRRQGDRRIFSIAIKALSPQDQDFVARSGSAKVEEPSGAPANCRLGKFIIATADAKPRPLQLRIKYNNRDVWSGKADALAPIDLPVHVDTDFNEEPQKGYAKNDRIYLYVESEDYASQWHLLKKTGDKLTLKNDAGIKLHRKKYAVIEYAFYQGDDPDFTGREPDQGGVVAVGHWGSLPGFGRDWQIWQGAAEPGDLWGDALLLEFHRGTPENGIIKSANANFQQMRKAPLSGYVHHGACGAPKLVAKAGACYYSRVVGHTRSTRGYGKIYIKEITEKVPDGIELITR